MSFNTLLRAVREASEEEALAFVATQSDLAQRDERGFTIAAYAAQSGKVKVLEALQARGESLSILTPRVANKNLPGDLFAVAAKAGQIEVLEFLWRKNVRYHPESASPVLTVSMSKSKAQNRLDAMKWCVEHGADLTQSDVHNGNALGNALFQDKPDQFRYLLGIGMDLSPPGYISVADRLGKTEKGGGHRNEIRSIFDRHLAEVGAAVNRARDDIQLCWKTNMGADALLAPFVSNGEATPLLLQIAAAGKIPEWFEENLWQDRAAAAVFYDGLHEALPPHYRNRLQETVDISWARRELAAPLNEKSAVHKWAQRPGASGREVG